MKKIILVGRTSAGKTTLTQVLRSRPIVYEKTQYINHHDIVIDTPGEYAETKVLARALALYSYEADIIGFLISATDDHSIYPPNVTPCVNREVIGIVTQIDKPGATPERAEEWLRLAGCETVYHVSAISGEGVWQIFRHLGEPGDILPWGAMNKEN